MAVAALSSVYFPLSLPRESHLLDNYNHPMKSPWQWQHSPQYIFPCPCQELQHDPLHGGQEYSYGPCPSSTSQLSPCWGGCLHSLLLHWLSLSGSSQCRS